MKCTLVHSSLVSEELLREAVHIICNEWGGDFDSRLNKLKMTSQSLDSNSGSFLLVEIQNNNEPQRVLGHVELKAGIAISSNSPSPDDSIG